MENSSNNLKKLKKLYGFDKNDIKWISNGADILKYIGIETIFVEFIKDAEGNWTNKLKKSIITSITDFDPMTDTYLIKYRLVDEDKDTSWREMRIISEGFSFGNPEETGKMYRFVPYSLHCKLAETEAFYARIKNLFEKRDTLSLESLKQISESKEKEKTLSYRCNIGAAIKTVDGDILWFRLSNITLRHTHKDKYSLTLTDDNNKTYYLNISSNDTSYKFSYSKGEVIGDIKIIDLED